MNWPRLRPILLAALIISLFGGFGCIDFQLMLFEQPGQEGPGGF